MLLGIKNWIFIINKILTLLRNIFLKCGTDRNFDAGFALCSVVDEDEVGMERIERCSTLKRLSRQVIDVVSTRKQTFTLKTRPNSSLNFVWPILSNLFMHLFIYLPLHYILQQQLVCNRHFLNALQYNVAQK